MPDDVTGEQASTEAVNPQAAQEATQTTEGAAQGAASSQPGASSWKVGDTTYTDPNEMYKGFTKWQGEFTRKSQEYSKKEKEYTQKLQTYERAFEIIRSDPSLTELVRAKIQAGMSPQQAVQQTAQQAQVPPEIMEKINHLETREQEREQDAAIDSFGKSHKDLTDAEWDQMGDFIEQNEEWLGKMPPARQMSVAFAEVVVPSRLQKQAMEELAAKQKGEESENGKKAAFLGSQAPTAGAKPTGLPERKRGMTPAQEREYAAKVFRASGQKR